MKLLSLQIGTPKNYGDKDATDYYEKAWRTAIFREPVVGPLWLGKESLAGDQVTNRRHHGGPDKAVNVYPSEHYAQWRDELNLPEMTGGGFGENFTTEGWLESEICIGDSFEIGSAIVQVSQPRQPCATLARRWRVKDFPARVINANKTGWYLRVLQGGEVRAGLTFTLLARPHPEWTIAAANEVMYVRKKDAIATRALADCPALSAAWRDELLERLESSTGETA
jgi:MOSC domain-containing protein YiiM